MKDMTREELRELTMRKKREYAMRQLKEMEAPFRDKDGLVVVSDVMKAITSPEAFEVIFRKVIQLGNKTVDGFHNKNK